MKTIPTFYLEINSQLMYLLFNEKSYSDWLVQARLRDRFSYSQLLMIKFSFTIYKFSDIPHLSYSQELHLLTFISTYREAHTYTHVHANDVKN